MGFCSQLYKMQEANAVNLGEDPAFVTVFLHTPKHVGLGLP